MSDGTTYITEVEMSPHAEGVLSGLDVAIKDNISTAGVRTTCASRMLAEYVPPYDATVVERVRAAGARIVGKANMDEFGMGGTTETSAFGAVPNPVDGTRVAGGSSGGSAVAVAEGSADIALGSDTGGSVRNPAAFCGVVGLKPTYGRVSRYGLVAYANSLEQIGPLGPDVASVARLLGVIAGADPRDATTQDRPAADPTGYVDAVTAGVEGMTIGVVPQLFDGADAAVAARVRDRIDALTDAGAAITTVELPALEHAVAAYYVIAMAEASSNLARFDGVRYGIGGGEGNWNTAFARARTAGFGTEVTRRILLGTYALSAGYHDRYYAKAQDARAWLRSQFAEAFDTVDVLATPTMPITAPRLGEQLEDPLTLYQMDANTVPVNLANLPAISVPAGRVDGLPVGAQVIGPAFDEVAVLRVAGALEAAG
ncbi:MAG: Asp-tRNA(Asn)/Glu-tRNA(Gln) amidotransferase subunit GatA [Haloferacaceae archaeon]|nr:Asp-tRNA(Asn)/Glu-tRNA(Gln) amidotransferase subunit GatA [Haloferacaceae archaeon]